VDRDEPFDRHQSTSGAFPEFGLPGHHIISYDNDATHRTMKNCSHSVFLPEYHNWSGWAGYNSYHDYEYDNFGMHGDFSSLGASSLEPTPLTLASFNARAFQAMEPSFEGDLHLTNFLLELVDIKRLLMLASKWKGLVTNYMRTADYLSRRSTLQQVKFVAKEVANGHLAMSFGIKPFIRDVMGMYSTLTGLSERITDFMARRGTPQVRHYREELYDDVYEQDDGQIASANIFRKIVRSGKVTAWATMYYTYECPDIVTLGQKVDIYRDLLGLRFGFAQIWEAIPFSFVVDWFIKVQDFLEQLNKPLFKVSLTVTDYCISYKVDCLTESLISTTGATMGANVTNAVTASLKSSKYVRRVQAPNSGYSFINYGQYGRNQLALSASLAMGLTKVGPRTKR
jgi:hypothetical protein